jgi:hypothetical protein
MGGSAAATTASCILSAVSAAAAWSYAKSVPSEVY